MKDRVVVLDELVALQWLCLRVLLLPRRLRRPRRQMIRMVPTFIISCLTSSAVAVIADRTSYKLITA